LFAITNFGYKGDREARRKDFANSGSWERGGREVATWKEVETMKSQFSDVNLDAKIVSGERSIVRPMVKIISRFSKYIIGRESEASR